MRTADVSNTPAMWDGEPDENNVELQDTPAFTVKQKVEWFCDAVRAKKNWYFKILDEERDLGTKWAQEAGYLQPGKPPGAVELAIQDALEELKGEANRIRAFDHPITYHCSPSQTRPGVHLHEIDTDVLNALKYLRCAQYAIQEAELRQDVGIFISDGAVPASLHRELVAELDALASVEPKDFHPDTYGKVQDLIHPSLYPYIAGVTYSHKPTPALTDGKFKTTMEEIIGYHSEFENFESSYSWIPSTFRVSKDGLDVHIESYINGLGPREQYGVLYHLIEKLFLLALPHFERTLAVWFEPAVSPSVERWDRRSNQRQGSTREAWNALKATQALEKAEKEREVQTKQEQKRATTESDWRNMSHFQSMDDSVAGSTFRGRDLKVIVKAANYVLKPGQEYEGTWHMEGMPHERIVASVIYYYETDLDILDQGLSFRYLRCLSSDFPTEENHHSNDFEIYFEKGNDDGGQEDGEDEQDYPSDWETEIDNNGMPSPMSTYSLGRYITVGTVPTTNFAGDYSTKNDNDLATTDTGSTANREKPTTGRIVSFPNWVQHKVESVKNGSNNSVVQRKILCFFLVDDEISDSQVNLKPNQPWGDTVRYHSFSYHGLMRGSVLTTSDVPSQKREPVLYSLLPIACQKLTGKNLPNELVTHIVDLGDLGLSREMAELHRRMLMKDRKVAPTQRRDDMYSLCEH